MKPIGKKPKIEYVDKMDAMDRMWSNNQVVYSKPEQPPKPEEKTEEKT